jgi:hypothetical protein
MRSCLHKFGVSFFDINKANDSDGDDDDDNNNEDNEDETTTATSTAVIRQAIAQSTNASFMVVFLFYFGHPAKEGRRGGG